MKPIDEIWDKISEGACPCCGARNWDMFISEKSNTFWKINHFQCSANVALNPSHAGILGAQTEKTFIDECLSCGATVSL
jgi:hypothetical protein